MLRLTTFSPQPQFLKGLLKLNCHFLTPPRGIIHKCLHLFIHSPISYSFAAHYLAYFSVLSIFKVFRTKFVYQFSYSRNYILDCFFLAFEKRIMFYLFNNIRTFTNILTSLLSTLLMNPFKIIFCFQFC